MDAIVCSAVFYTARVGNPLNVRWVIESILHGGPIEYFSLQPVLHNWNNKDRGVCYPVCGMVHIKEPLLLIRKSNSCRFFSLSGHLSYFDAIYL